MRVDGLIYASDELIQQMRHDQAPDQVANVATLPGIQLASLAMPDIHWGYGFTIGGVCATDPLEGGVISPGGVGYDINCGVRLLRSNLFYQDVKPHMERLVDGLFRSVPAGTGRKGKYRFSEPELRQLMGEGVPFLKGRGLATDDDVEFTEARGCLAGAEPDNVSDRAIQRGRSQCGTLGSGNHFMEVQVVEAVVDEEAAEAMGLAKDMICVMIHSGSRGLGYQVCDDALRLLMRTPRAVRNRTPRPATRLRTGRQPGGQPLRRRDACRRKLCVVQPPVADVAGARSLRKGLLRIVAKHEHGTCL
jgi:tRNA-splicing ligase RtcB